ncbi:MAG TPA: hypothetical protein DCS93_30395 [Microscillaceae bacterium]|nr:hypothetical protein [Microscillaceae bacterium]
MENKQLNLQFRNTLTILFFVYIFVFNILIFNINTREGFFLPYRDWFKLLGLSLFAFNLSVVKHLVPKRKLLVFHFHYLLLLYMLLIVVLSFLPASISKLFFYSFIFLGYASTLLNIYLIFTKLTYGTLLLMLPLGFIFSNWIIGKLYSTYGGVSPMFMERIAFGIAHLDTLFHLSIAQMFKTHGVSSNGLDGIPYLGYHYASHWLFARISVFSGLSLVKIYNYLYPFLFLPLYFKVVLHLTLKLYNFFKKQILDLNITTKVGICFWAIFMVAHIGLLPQKTLNSFTYWHSYIVSESFLIGLIFFYIVIWVLIDYHEFGNTPFKKWFFKVTLLFLVIICLFSKISIGVLLIPVLAYIQFRNDQFFKWKNLIFWAIGLFFFYQCFNLTSNGETVLKVKFMHFFHTYSDKDFWYYQVPIHYITLFLFLISYFYEIEKTNPKTSLLKLIKTRQVIPIETLILFAFLGLLPLLWLVVEGGSAIYFSSITQKLSILLLLCMSPMLVERFAHTPVITRGFLIIIFLIPFFLMMIDNSNRDYKKALTKTQEQRDKMKTLAGLEGLPNKQMQQKMLYKREFIFARVLDSLERLPVSQKKKMLIHVPHEDYFYTHYDNTLKVSFIIPALTGIATINGLSKHKETKKWSTYGLGVYQSHPYLPLIGSDEPKHVISRAKVQGLEDKEIYQLRTILKPYPDNHKTDIKYNERVVLKKIK